MSRLFPADSRDVYLTLNGFPLYGVDDYGVEWHTTFRNITGIFDGVGSTLETSDKAFTDGWFGNQPTRQGRTITIEGELLNACPEDLIQAWDSLKRILLLGDQLLEITMGSLKRQIMVRQSSSAPLLKWAGLNVLKFSLSLTALSSYLQSTSVTSANTGLPYTTGGMTFPYRFGTRKHGALSTAWLGTAQKSVSVLKEDGIIIAHNYCTGSRTLPIGSGKWVDGSYRKSGVGSTTNVTLSDSPVSGVTQGVQTVNTNNVQCGVCQDHNSGLTHETLALSVWAKGPGMTRIQPTWKDDNDIENYPYNVLTDSSWHQILACYDYYDANSGFVSSSFLFSRMNSTNVFCAPILCTVSEHIELERLGVIFFDGDGYSEEPITSSWVFGETTMSGSIHLSNNGTGNSPITMRIDGPVTNPTVTHVQSGRVMKANITLGAGHYLTYDGTTHQVLLDGTDPQQGIMVRREWSQALLGDNDWQFSADEYANGAKLTVSFREQYI